MGNRLSKIVTRTGDAGTTGLGDGSRVAKDCSRIEAIGEVDELNSSLGVILAESIPGEIRETLIEIQHDLFDLGGELCIPGATAILEAHILRVEERVNHFNGQLTPLKEFILPGGTRAAALAHMSRAICRRVERQVIRLANEEAVSEHVRKYLNRLSDLLFVLGRTLNMAGGGGDVLWKPRRNEAKS